MPNKKPSASSLKELTKLIAVFRAERHWKRFRNSKELILGLFIETAELAEHFQYLEGEELQQHIELFKDDIGEELADVLYWVLLTAHELEIDLDETFRDKMKKNALKYPRPEGGEEGEGKLAQRRQKKMMAKRQL